jgi:hypothetical protein
MDDFMQLRMAFADRHFPLFGSGLFKHGPCGAPQRRIGSYQWRMLREPSVSWLPKRTSSPGACCTFIIAQSASSSSATTIVRLVRTPWPISERLQTTVTMPSAPMLT